MPLGWLAHPMHFAAFGGTSSPQGYSPSQMITAYGLPSSGGNGTTIAIVNAFDTPNILTYYDTFSNQYGLPDNSSGSFLVHKMAKNMQTDGRWTSETCLDVEWAHAIAPNATILLVEAVNPTNAALLSAVDYATSWPGVIAVSMSWGGDEFFNEASFDYHFNKPGITFFASSGDDGSTVMWPAASAIVVSVGGTTLNLNTDGTIISEIAWSNSSGGISSYIDMPPYQTNFGLTHTKRAVPDVSYNGNASTGVAVYNGTWWRMGGTSAGAPQWAAIHALGQSATNTNLYNRAKTAYSTYVGDVTAGSNYVNNASTGYDLVTGLGSPLTTNFDAEVTVTPTYGPPNGSVTLNGVGFDPNTSLNISYLNPINATWLPLINNITITSDTFSYQFRVSDLLQNNIAGENQPQFDNIIFKITDSKGIIYSPSMPYAEWRRGLSQVGNLIASGLFGNSSDLSANLFVQSGDLVPISGKWFSPGNVSVIWDNRSIGILSTDSNGFFYGTLQVPATTAGKHTLNIDDGASIFSLKLTCLPTVASDYVNEWHTQTFAINLTPSSQVNETFYRINGGSIQNVTANGQPKISNEGSGNSLEYWSTWSLYGTSLIDLPHIKIVGIKLDRTAPAGNVTTNLTSNTSRIILSPSAADETSGVAQMRFSNDGDSWSSWEPYGTSKIWVLPNGDGQKTVTAQFIDNAGLTADFSCSINLTTSQPAVALTAEPPPTPSKKPSPVATPDPVLTQTATPTNSELIYNTAPFITLTDVAVVSIIAAIVCLCAFLFQRRK
ncbi:MAG: hypothetical protein ACM3UN_04650 [Bacillota bacterium]